MEVNAEVNAPACGWCDTPARSWAEGRGCPVVLAWGCGCRRGPGTDGEGHERRGDDD